MALGESFNEIILAVKDDKENEDKKEEESEKKIIALENVEQIDSILEESLFEIELDILEQYHAEKIFLEKTEEEKVKKNYQDVQTKIILSDIERKSMWHEYKCYVDKFVLIGLQDATLCR